LRADVLSTKERNAGELGKAAFIQAHDLPLESPRRCGDDEIVSASWSSSSPNVRQQSGVRLGHLKVVGLDRYGI
jgi:hypothetical protein